MTDHPAPDLSRVPEDVRSRVLLTTSCHDCDEIPKVENAGQVITRDDGQQVRVMHNGVLVEAGGYFGDWSGNEGEIYADEALSTTQDLLPEVLALIQQDKP